MSQYRVSWAVNRGLGHVFRRFLDVCTNPAPRNLIRRCKAPARELSGGDENQGEGHESGLGLTSKLVNKLNKQLVIKLRFLFA